jgi:hypothetical protein
VAAVYFCWVCGQLADRSIATMPHYETGLPVRFCSAAHRAEYEWLAAL